VENSQILGPHTQDIMEAEAEKTETGDAEHYLLKDIEQLKERYTKADIDKIRSDNGLNVDDEVKVKSQRTTAAAIKVVVATTSESVAPSAFKVFTEVIEEEAKVFEKLARNRRWELQRRKDKFKMDLLNMFIAFVTEKRRPPQKRSMSQECWND